MTSERLGLADVKR